MEERDFDRESARISTNKRQKGNSHSSCRFVKIRGSFVFIRVHLRSSADAYSSALAVERSVHIFRTRSFYRSIRGADSSIRGDSLRKVQGSGTEQADRAA